MLWTAANASDHSAHSTTTTTKTIENSTPEERGPEPVYTVDLTHPSYLEGSALDQASLPLVGLTVERGFTGLIGGLFASVVLWCLEATPAL